MPDEPARRPRGALRIAILHPTSWPEIRRGSERFMNELSAWLGGRGHHVTVVTTHRGPRERRMEGGLEVLRRPRFGTSALARRGFEPLLATAPSAFAALATGRFDVAHALALPEAAAAGWWARLSGRPFVASLMGYPDTETLDAFRGRRRLLASVASRASAVHVLSEAAAGAVRASASIDAIAIPPGVDCAAFAGERERHPLPTVFCPADAADPRKRVELLVRAFAVVRDRHPEARLVLDGRPREAPGWARAPGVEVVDVRAGEGLAVAYATAWVTALPSRREAFGLVLAESLAAGTPIVGAREGGIPEIVADAPGELFEPDDAADLARALDRVLALAVAGDVRERCRARARRWDWSEVGPRYEALYGTGARG